MNEALVIFYLIVGILLRIAVPIAITFLLGAFLKRLDAKWRAEGLQTQAQQSAVPAAQATPQFSLACWEYNQCTPEKMEKCPAYAQNDKPCWEVYRSNGNLNKPCQTCEYRRLVTAPVLASI